MQIGQKIIHLESVDSTNNYVANLIQRKEITHGTVIMADEQFAGKGQRGAEWHVNPGENLTFSFLLENINLSISQQFFLTQVVSVSLVNLLKKLKLTAQIKWPNDIYINRNKVAGVLIENQVVNGMVNKSIIGIGLNVNQQSFEGFNATSLTLESGQSFPLHEVLFSFIHSFNEQWLAFNNQTKQVVKNEYLYHLLNYQKIAKYMDEAGEFDGKITGVTEAGQLQILKENQVNHYDIKGIQFIL
jgi:BirA family biotin operon repressor/biotin-[acetyl-CoA-carboxylase] ligase